MTRQLITTLVGIALLAGCSENQFLPTPPVTPKSVASPVRSPVLQTAPEGFVVRSQQEPSSIENTESEPNSDTHVWLKPYSKLDGTFVEGHWRKKTDGELRGKKPKKEKLAPVVTTHYEEPSYSYSGGNEGGGGSVHVKGYTRKDGTYVAPHTRSAARRK
jgi:hypothetical protein